MKRVRIEDAVGSVLAHDITRIVPGKFKGPAFRRGHILRREDIPELLKLGKRSLYVLELSEGQLHEDEAAVRIARAICGEGLMWSEPREGKSNIISERRGLLQVKARALFRINRMGGLVVSTLKNNFPCSKKQVVAATRIIPLVTRRERIERLEALAEKYHPVLRVLPYRGLRVGAVVTGSELYEGLVRDQFGRYVGKKLREYGCKLVKKIIVQDDPRLISDAIRMLKEMGCELILATGGLSVDPDDVTLNGIKRAGGRICIYGAPVLPGAMFLYADLEGTPVIGLPACVYYHRATIFDLVLPILLAGQEITRDQVAEMGHGGLCMDCKPCRFPACPFGR